MVKTPSQKTNRIRPPEGLNLVPLIDIVTNLMFFLMMFASVIPVVMIDAPLPKIASTADEVKIAKDKENKLEVTLSISSKGFSVKSDYDSVHSFTLGVDGKFPYTELHKYLVQLHQKRDKSREITLLPSDDTPYEVLVEVMDASRELVNGDSGYQPVPPEIAQKPESSQFNRLFPDVSIGGV